MFSPSTTSVRSPSARAPTAISLEAVNPFCWQGLHVPPGPADRNSASNVPSSSAYFPVAQIVHVSCPGRDVFPRSQARQSTSPSCFVTSFPTCANSLESQISNTTTMGWNFPACLTCITQVFAPTAFLTLLLSCAILVLSRRTNCTAGDSASGVLSSRTVGAVRFRVVGVIPSRPIILKVLPGSTIAARTGDRRAISSFVRMRFVG